MSESQAKYNAACGVVRITIPGPPVAKGRPRVMRNGITFTPDKTQKWEATAMLFAQVAMQGRGMLDGGVLVSVHAYFPIPASWPRWKREEAEMESVWHVTRPDGDNVAKAVLDAMQGIVFKDDSAACSVCVYKRYSADPRVEVAAKLIGGLHSRSTREQLNEEAA